MKTKTTKKAVKKVVKKVTKPKEKIELFYVDNKKLARAKAMAKDAKGVRAEYEKLGGLLREGFGIEPV